MNNSLQDVFPWSFIYGELNKQNKELLKHITTAIIVDYLYDRINNGWKENDPEMYFGRALNICLNNKLITHNEIQNASIIIKRNSNPSSIDYYTDYLRFVISANDNEVINK